MHRSTNQTTVSNSILQKTHESLTRTIAIGMPILAPKGPKELGERIKNQK